MQICQSTGLALSAHRLNDWSPIPVLTGAQADWEHFGGLH